MPISRALLQNLSDEEIYQLRTSVVNNNAKLWIAENIPKHAVTPKHLEPVIRVFQRIHAGERVRVLLSMPPRHGKTDTILGCLAWLINVRPDLVNAYCSYTNNIAFAKSKRCRKWVLDSGVELREDTSTASIWLRKDRDGGLISAGVDGALTGLGITGVGVMDDPFKGRKQAESIVERERVWDFFKSVFYTRLENASVVVVSTRWHEDDLIGRIQKLNGTEFGEWEVINLPAIRDEEILDTDQCTASDDGFALWPERFPVNTLKTIRSVIGNNEFSTLYQQQPFSIRDGKVFNSPTFYDSSPSICQKVISLDVAGTINPSSDSSAIVALLAEQIRQEKRNEHDYLFRTFIDHVSVFKAYPQDTAKRCLLIQQRYQGAPILIEATRDGYEVAKELRRYEPKLLVVMVPARGTKLFRVTRTASAWNSGDILVRSNCDWVTNFISDIEKFTGEKSKEKDDSVDALGHGWNYLYNNFKPQDSITNNNAIPTSVNPSKNVRPMHFRQGGILPKYQKYGII